MRHIINQDRDSIHCFTGSEYFYPSAVQWESQIMGFNLMMSKNNLGTFDSIEEVVVEISRIFNSKDEVILISGYSQGGFAEW